MSKGYIRHMFAGGNTSQGFFSYYDYIISQEDATKIFIIKGGPGVGKSTFMKKIGNYMTDIGYDVEYMHCSSDNNSLDGIVIPSIGVALMDGTAPHIVDPKNPGAVDEIIHLGDYWNDAEMRKHKEEIMATNREIGRLFARAYRYIKAAACFYEDTKMINSWAIDNAKVNTEAEYILLDVFGTNKVSVNGGWERKLFASAITPNGLKNYLHSLLYTDKIYVLKGQQGTGTEKILEKIKNAAIDRGYDVEAYYCALIPTKLEHIVIPDLNVSLTTFNEYHNAELEAYVEIDLDEYLDRNILNEYSDVINYNKSQFDSLLEKAIETIGKAKDLHDRMEQFYIPNMDFEAVEMCYESTLSRILELINN